MTGTAGRPIDRASVAGAAAAPERHVPIVVIGAGPAGLAAAVAGARAGAEVMLIDEHPVASQLMGLDVPYHFGQRMDGAVQNKPRMLERLVETNPGIAEAFELGIDIQLGIYVAGAVVPGPTVRTLSKPRLVLADEERSWMVSFDRLVVAAGARDLGLSFSGWEKPGVMGAQAAAALLRRYRAFAGRRLVILGSGALALGLAESALAEGREVAAIVEVAGEVQGPAPLRDRLAARGVPFLIGAVIKEAAGASEVESAIVARLDAAGQPISGSETAISCDTIVTAIGAVPNIELLDVIGCKLELRSERGGYVPALDGELETSISGIYAAGDCAGSFAEKLLEPAIAAAEGRRAGAAAARSLGLTPTEAPAPKATPGGEQHGTWRRWLDASLAASGFEVNICQCEEVTRRELVELRPPRYLGWGSSQMASRNVARLAEDGPVNQDQVKRLTRAGMGPCQGRRCREQVQMLLAKAANVALDRIPLASYRAPLRPLPLSVLWPQEEPQAMRDNWVAWFDIPTQWTPHWEIAAETPADAEDIAGLGVSGAEK